VSGDTSATGVTFVKIAGTNAYVVRRTLTPTVTKVSSLNDRANIAPTNVAARKVNATGSTAITESAPAADGDCDERRDERRDRDVRERLPRDDVDRRERRDEQGLPAPVRRSSRTDEPYAWMRKFIGTRKNEREEERDEREGRGSTPATRPCRRRTPRRQPRDGESAVISIVAPAALARGVAAGEPAVGTSARVARIVATGASGAAVTLGAVPAERRAVVEPAGPADVLERDGDRERGGPILLGRHQSLVVRLDCLPELGGRGLALPRVAGANGNGLDRPTLPAVKHDKVGRVAERGAPERDRCE